MDNIAIEPKFKIQDRVCSKKTGYPMIGSFVKVIFYQEYAKTIPFYTQIVQYCNWKYLFPEFWNKHIYVVLSDKSQKPYTKEEMMIGLPDNFKNLEDKYEEVINKIYENVQETEFLIYVEDDLELL